MQGATVALAKLAAILGAVRSALSENASRLSNPNAIELRQSFYPEHFRNYFYRADEQLDVLRAVAPDFFDDFPPLLQQPSQKLINDHVVYSRAQMTRLARDIEQVLEIRANSQHAHSSALESPNRVFITHGHAKDWLEVQAYIERDLALQTLELSQEASTGNTIIEKLEANAARCNSAVIVMSGDDVDQGGQVRARENVMHEIGFFHGKYGRANVILLHQDGVSVPTNLSGIVYVPYPKGYVSAGFAVMARELKATYTR